MLWQPTPLSKWRPQTTVSISEDQAATLFRLLEALDDNDDVQKVFSNFEVAEDDMRKLGG